MQYSAYFRKALEAVSYLRAKPFDLTSPLGRSKERYRLIAFTAAASMFSKALTILISLISMPIVFNYAGKEQFAIWVIANSLVLWMQLFDFGVANGLTNAIAEAHGRGDKLSASKYFSSALAATFLIVLICLPILFVVCFSLPWDTFFHIYDPKLKSLASRSLFFVGFAFIVNIPLSLISRVLMAYQRGYIISLYQGVAGIFSLLALILAVDLELNFLWMILIMAFTPLITNLALWFSISKVIDGIYVRFSMVTKQGLFRVASSSLPLFLFQCGALLINQLVILIIARTSNLAMVSDFNIVWRVYLLCFSVAAAFSNPFYPAIREAFEKRELHWVKKAIIHALKIRLLATTAFIICLLISGDFILKLWIRSDQVIQIGHLGWLAVCISLIFSATGSLFSEVLNCLDDIWSQVLNVFFSGILALLLFIVLIPKLGLIGVFVSFSITAIYPVMWGYRRLRKVVQYENSSN